VKRGIVAERAEERWQALIKGDLDAAYQFLSSGTKTAKPLALYKAQVRPGIWRGAKVGKVTCQRELCSVTVRVTYDTKVVRGVETDVGESWIIEDGTARIILR
jgi:hypothetical protein